MTIGFLGAGKMAEALIDALLTARRVKPGSLLACDRLAARREHLHERYGVGVFATPETLLEQADTLVLAVKPQDLDALLTDLAPQLTRRHLLISIAAGKSLAGMQSRTGSRMRLARVMPNMAVQVGEGMSVYCLGTAARPSDAQRVERLLNCAGKTLCLPEAQFDWVTALSGSGPAFLAWLLEGMIAAATANGLPREVADTLAVQTLLGTARLLRDGGWDPESLMRAVASPGGTTAAGLRVLDESGTRATLTATLEAAAHRSRELSV